MHTQVKKTIYKSSPCLPLFLISNGKVYWGLVLGTRWVWHVLDERVSEGIVLLIIPKEIVEEVGHFSLGLLWT